MLFTSGNAYWDKCVFKLWLSFHSQKTRIPSIDPDAQTFSACFSNICPIHRISSRYPEGKSYLLNQSND